MKTPSFPLTVYMRQAMVQSAMDDCAKPDFDKLFTERMNVIARDRMPVAIRTIFDSGDKQAIAYLNRVETSYWSFKSIAFREAVKRHFGDEKLAQMNNYSFDVPAVKCVAETGADHDLQAAVLGDKEIVGILCERLIWMRKRVDARNKLQEALRSCRTSKAVEERMPEMVRYLPKREPAAKHAVVLYQPVSLLKELGWPDGGKPKTEQPVTKSPKAKGKGKSKSTRSTKE